MAKYKVGDVLIPAMAGDEKTRLHVTQIEEVTCSAGTQVIYVGTVWLTEYANKKGFIARTPIKFNEIEIS